jgi:trk system potassium uptake protein TrkH
MLTLVYPLAETTTTRRAAADECSRPSVMTTTGFTTRIYPLAGGLAGAAVRLSSAAARLTAGGLKVVRCLLLVKQGRREIIRLVHPSAEIPVQLGGRAVPLRIVDAIWGFFAVYVGVFTVLMLSMMATGLDQVTAFSAVAATLNNLGPGLGDVAQNYAEIGPVGKWICVLAMLLGRLEIFTLLILFTVTFWRK